MNILLVNLDQAKLYPPRIQQYIKSKGVNCYLSRWRKTEIDTVLKIYNLRPDNTIIHARVAGLNVNDTFKNLELQGYRVINNSLTLELTSNKYKSFIQAKKNNIPCAETVIVNKYDISSIKKFLMRYRTIVLKPVYSQGLGKFCKKIDSENSQLEIENDAKDIPGEEINVQEYIPYTKLIRVIVIGGKALREATTYDEPRDDWKASVCMNPNLKKYDFQNPTLLGLAEKTARSFNAEITFIDFFENKEGEIILNEINTACGLIIHEDVTRIEIHKYIGNYLIQQIQEFKGN